MQTDREKTLRIHWIQFGSRAVPTPGYGIISSSSEIPVNSRIIFERQCNHLWPDSVFDSSLISFALPITTDWIVIGIANRSGTDHAGRRNAWLFSGLFVNSTWENLRGIDPFLLMTKADSTRDANKKYLDLSMSEIAINLALDAEDSTPPDTGSPISYRKARLIIQNIWRESPDSFILPCPENTQTKARYIFRNTRKSHDSFYLSITPLEKECQNMNSKSLLNRLRVPILAILLLVAALVPALLFHDSEIKKLKDNKIETVERLNNQIRSLKEQVSSLNEKVIQAEKKKRDITSELQVAKQELSAQREKNATLKSDLDRTRSALSEAQKNADAQLLNENEELGKRNAKYEERLRTYHQEVDRALNHITESQRTLLDLQKRTDSPQPVDPN